MVAGIGPSTSNFVRFPTRLANLPELQANESVAVVDAGLHFSVALTDAGALYSWGVDFSGVLPTPTRMRFDPGVQIVQACAARSLRSALSSPLLTRARASRGGSRVRFERRSEVHRLPESEHGEGLVLGVTRARANILLVLQEHR